ncbi:hypothetical protein RchiOBHm_Chr6g0269931 [Rosa chinensis]|uniref:Uncharacterized protein n=1 Tax=Rosa chinensis TaxID=74649 RepID=A0A2P6PQL6_ROSCH|nr:hypothetical protein RchiOBHm_Chr6g0269931 [Rosa chinensis]
MFFMKVVEDVKPSPWTCGRYTELLLDEGTHMRDRLNCTGGSRRIRVDYFSSVNVFLQVFG